MKREPNKLRIKLARGECVTGSAVFSWSPYVVDVAGQSGLDYLRIDTEHSWRRDDMLEQLIRAALLADIVPIVRIDRDDPYLARKVLEIGAGGIVVPDICSVEDAEAVVQSAKFPPRGTRGYSGICLSGGWGGQAGAEWVEWSDSEPMVGIMIENAVAMENIDQIMAVDGIDFALFGAADYSMSLGLGAPKSSDERVQAAIRNTAAAARKSGKHFSIGVGTDVENIKKHMELGADMLELGNDLGHVRTAWKRAVETAGNIKAEDP
jgi:4-hydroxy-2-oxoheptanedioate aldolase